MKTSLQFHGARREIFAMAFSWSKEWNLSMFTEHFYPTYEIRSISDRDALDVTANRLALGFGKIDTSAKRSYDFLADNPEMLTILIGKEDAGILEESFLGAVAEDVDTMASWKRMRSLARKEMLKGLWLQDSSSGNLRWDQSRCYTPGARDLAMSGWILAGATPAYTYRIDASAS